MNKITIEKIGNAALNKSFMLKDDSSKYMLSSVMGGVFASIGIIIALTIGAIFAQHNSPSEKLISAVTFSIALMLIVFTGTELFTGNNMTMIIGRLSKKIKTSDLFNVWLATWLGNLLGTIIMAFIYVGSGLANRNLTLSYFTNIAQNKLAIAPSEMFFRGVLCNFLVCMAIFMAYRLKDEVAKMIAICLIIIAFFVSGFEHCIANMGIYTIAYIAGGIANVSIAKIAFATVMVTLGNIVGGGLLVGAVFYRMSTKKFTMPSINIGINRCLDLKFIYMDLSRKGA